MGRLPRTCSLTALCLAIAAPPPPEVTAQESDLQDATVVSTERVTTRAQVTPHPYAPGDTIGVRVVLYNLTDVMISIESPACGLAVREELETRLIHPLLEARLVLPEGGCVAPPTRLEPADSIAVSARAVVLSPPGRYVLHVEPPRPASGHGANSFGTGVKVTRPGASEPRPISPREPAKTVRYAVRLHDPENQPMTVHEIHDVVQEAIRVAGGFGLPMSLEAALMAPPYLLVEIEDTSKRTRWVCEEDSTRHAIATFLGERHPTPPDFRPSPFVDGGRLALMVESAAERGPGCLPTR